jgi:hypothetical protein
VSCYPTLETLRWHRAEHERVDSLYRAFHNEKRRTRRKWLYDNDPIWRLTKLKAKWERRERARREGRVVKA